MNNYDKANLGKILSLNAKSFMHENCYILNYSIDTWIFADQNEDELLQSSDKNIFFTMSCLFSLLLLGKSPSNLKGNDQKFTFKRYESTWP